MKQPQTWSEFYALSEQLRDAERHHLITQLAYNRVFVDIMLEEKVMSRAEKLAGVTEEYEAWSIAHIACSHLKRVYQIAIKFYGKLEADDARND